MSFVFKNSCIPTGGPGATDEATMAVQVCRNQSISALIYSICVLHAELSIALRYFQPLVSATPFHVFALQNGHLVIPIAISGGGAKALKDQVKKPVHDLICDMKQDQQSKLETSWDTVCNEVMHALIGLGLHQVLLHDVDLRCHLTL